MFLNFKYFVYWQKYQYTTITRILSIDEAFCFGNNDTLKAAIRNMA
jgi:hypothetical protein